MISKMLKVSVLGFFVFTGGTYANIPEELQALQAAKTVHSSYKKAVRDVENTKRASQLERKIDDTSLECAAFGCIGHTIYPAHNPVFEDEITSQFYKAFLEREGTTIIKGIREKREQQRQELITKAVIAQQKSEEHLLETVSQTMAKICQSVGEEGVAPDRVTADALFDWVQDTYDRVAVRIENRSAQYAPLVKTLYQLDSLCMILRDLDVVVPDDLETRTPQLLKRLDLQSRSPNVTGPKR